MLTALLYRFLCRLVPVFAGGGRERELEIIVMRHQLAILRRGGKRPRYTTADRAVLAAASRLLPRERWSCFAVTPQTLSRWHRRYCTGIRASARLVADESGEATAMIAQVAGLGRQRIFRLLSDRRAK